MRIGRIVVLAAATLAALLCVSADETAPDEAAPVQTAPDRKAPIGEHFRDGEYCLTVTGVKSEADANLAVPAESEYKISIDGLIAPPQDVDAVCAASECTIATAVDADGKERLKPKPRRSYSSSASPDYNAVLGGLAAVKVDKAELLATPFSLDRMGLTNEVIIAKKREDKKLPAVVMEDFAKLANGVQVRVTSLNMSARRKFTVSVAYKRPAAGTQGAFLESIFVIDRDGKEIGGGRWTRGGGPFGSTGNFIGEYDLDSAQVHDSFRFVVVTSSEKKPVRFDVKDVFRR